MEPLIAFLVQLTYPYIFTKTKIQARSADAEEAEEEHKEAPKPGQFHHKLFKHSSSLRILRRTFKESGFVGWYQVCPSFSSLALYIYWRQPRLGSWGAALEGGSCADAALSVERSV